MYETQSHDEVLNLVNESLLIARLSTLQISIVDRFVLFLDSTELSMILSYFLILFPLTNLLLSKEDQGKS
jgi:hypothetical protein